MLTYECKEKLFIGLKEQFGELCKWYTKWIPIRGEGSKVILQYEEDFCNSWNVLNPDKMITKGDTHESVLDIIRNEEEKNYDFYESCFISLKVGFINIEEYKILMTENKTDSRRN